MKQTLTKRLAALAMCVLMLIGSVVPSFAADGEAADGENNQLITVSDSLSFITYEEYLSKYPPLEENRAKKGFTVSAADYDKEGTTASVEVKDYQGEKCVTTGIEGKVKWVFNVPESGFYTISVRYSPLGDRASSIERVFYLNDKVPFKETRHLGLEKTWKYVFAGNPADGRDGLFLKDGGGNELRPKFEVSYAWTDYVISDSNGYFTAPFEFYLEKGENSITFESIREEAAFSSLTFAPYEAPKSYADVSGEYSANGYTEPADVSAIHIDAEAPESVSAYIQSPITDRSSAITEPQSANLTMLNAIGGGKWTDNGQWIRYRFNVEKSGLYIIAPRYKQSTKNGIFVSRKLKIDGELPFEEAASIRFNFAKDWQVAPLSDDDGTPYQFYLEAGEHYIDFEVSLGDMATVLQQAVNTMDSINNDYLEITKLTGQDPDVNRDYGFARIMPETIADLSYQSQNLNAIIRMIASTSGIKSENTGTLATMVELLRKMGSNESKIASNLDSLAEQISSLGEWVNDMLMQPLMFDYIVIQPASAELPRATDGFLKSAGYEIQKFFASFFSDYDAIIDEESETGYDGELVCWISSGREQARIINDLIKDGFTKKENINVTLKLTAQNTLLPSILAGAAPDVCADGTLPLDMAVRGALVPLDGFDTFKEVEKRFAESAWSTQRLYDKTYGLPINQTFAVMFYRTDILADLGMEVPKTWDDLMSMVPVLQFNNMDVGIAAEFATFVFQNDGVYWEDGGMRTGLDNPKSLEALETLCEFFTQYSLPIAFNGPNRMKRGEMPLFIGEYTTYNTLVVSAPEIAGLWQIAEIPGFKRVDEDGNEYIDNRVASTSRGIIMPKGTKNQELAWRFMDWFTDKDYQVNYSNEMASILGPSAKQPVANLDAFEALPWTAQEKEVLVNALEKSVGVETYPGDYFVMRYLNFMFNRAYAEKEDPSDMMQEYAATINKELSRKRKEFSLMIAEEWDAVKEYTGLETYNDWMKYAKDNNIEDYKDWMSEAGISADNYDEWSHQTREGETTLDYKAWVAQN